ncbi:MAG TPA: Rieske 2Fe-2S domain-containing protein [Candidatus Thermoplasmatota archaeon]|nr:Rieske 2Fe-2S domain-containing protein [Candidatus Thermoplasmatota archaeon]
MPWEDAGPVEDLPVGRPMERWVGDHLVMLLRTGDGIAAAQGHCPHKATALLEGEYADGRVTCALHGACFDLVTGAPMPGQEWAGRLQLYPVRLEAGRVKVLV